MSAPNQDRPHVRVYRDGDAWKAECWCDGTHSSMGRGVTKKEAIDWGLAWVYGDQAVMVIEGGEQ
jgi:hypothetical protein